MRKYDGVRNIGLHFLYPVYRTRVRSDKTECLIRPNGKGEQDMKGYTVESGYMGYVDGVYMLFASETDYRDYLEN